LTAAVQELQAAGSTSPRLDAELLLAAAVRTDRTGLLVHLEAIVGDGPAQAFAESLARRRAGEPVAYIRGTKEFHGLVLATDRRALVPRPETEQLVELALARIAARLSGAPRPAGCPPLVVRDVGTGGGAIAVALAVALRRRRYEGAVAIVASDVAGPALQLALENAVGHGVADLIDVRSADLLAEPEADLLAGADADPGAARGPIGPLIDLVVANLPYLTSAELETGPPELRFEPAEALDGGADGLDLIRRLLLALPTNLAPGGLALLEIGAGQGQAVRQAVAQLPGAWRATIHQDLAGLDRVVEVGQA
jgi:release factor glutamine methyltransferase